MEGCGVGGVAYFAMKWLDGLMLVGSCVMLLMCVSSGLWVSVAVSVLCVVVLLTVSILMWLLGRPRVRLDSLSVLVLWCVKVWQLMFRI